MTDRFELFRAALARYCQTAAVRHERADDQAFLTQLFVACSPLTGMLPDAMVLQQSAQKEAAYKATYPDAMAVIAELDGQAAARLLIAWDQQGGSACVDVAVMPQHQSAGLGGAMLRAWIEVADSQGQPCTLEVLADSPARALYQRLGFREAAPSDHYQLSVPMVRACGGLPDQAG